MIHRHTVVTNPEVRVKVVGQIDPERALGSAALDMGVKSVGRDFTNERRDLILIDATNENAERFAPGLDRHVMRLKVAKLIVYVSCRSDFHWWFLSVFAYKDHYTPSRPKRQPLSQDFSDLFRRVRGHHPVPTGWFGVQ